MKVGVGRGKGEIKKKGMKDIREGERDDTEEVGKE